MVVDCVGWKSCPALLLMIPVLWSSCSLHQPALLPAPGKPEICFWTTFSTSITHFSHHVDSFKDGKLWYHWSDELPIHEQMSYPSLISRLFFICSVPLVHFLTQWSVPAPFFSFQASSFPFAEKLNSLVADRKEYWSLLICFCVHASSSQTYLLFCYGPLGRNHIMYFYSLPTWSPSSTALKHRVSEGTVGRSRSVLAQGSSPGMSDSV